MDVQTSRSNEHSPDRHSIETLEGRLPAVDRSIVITPAWSRTWEFEESVVPEWVYDAVFYQIYPDRFAIAGENLTPERATEWRNAQRGNYFLGGDLWGAAEKLEQLQDFGITAIYLNPVFISNEPHRYSTVDYKEVDPRLGGRAAFDGFINRAHALGLKVILDGVFNHCGIDFPHFQDALRQGPHSEYFEWFKFHTSVGFELQSNKQLRVAFSNLPASKGYCYECWNGVPTLPFFNHANRDVREFIYDVAQYWIDAGADGWRLDVPEMIKNLSFWREFRQKVHQINPDAYIVGEVWKNARRWLNDSDQFDGVMNYMLGKNILEAVMLDAPPPQIVGDSNYRHLRPQAMDDLVHKLARTLRRYPAQHVLAQMNVMGSHDTPRIFSVLAEDPAGLRMAHTINFIMPGVPCIYYGDELMLTGDHDPGCRAPYPLEIRAEQHEMRQFMQKLISARRQSDALSRGNVALYTGNHEDVAVIARYSEKELVLAFINRGCDDQVVDVNLRGNLSKFEDHKFPRAALNEIPMPRALNDLLGNGANQTVKVQQKEIRKVKIPARNVVLYGGWL